MFWSNDFHRPFGIALFAEFGDLIERHTVAIGRNGALAWPEQAIFAAKNATSSTVGTDVSGNRIRGMKSPISRQRCGIEQQKGTGERARVGAGGCEPP